MSSLDDLSRLPTPSPPPLSPVLEAELAQLAPVATRRPVRQLVLLVAASLLYGAGILAMLAMRPDAGALSRAWFVAVGLGWLVGFVAPLYLATVPRSGAVMPRWKLAGAASVVGSVLFVVLGLALPRLGAPGAQAIADPGWSALWHGYECLGAGVTAAIVPIVLGAILLRRSLPVGTRWIAAALGAGSGSLGGLVLHLHCPISDSLHVGVIHGGVVGISALLAAALVPRAIDVR
jgi:hypothetical protein